METLGGTLPVDASVALEMRRNGMPDAQDVEYRLLVQKLQSIEERLFDLHELEIEIRRDARYIVDQIWSAPALRDASIYAVDDVSRVWSFAVGLADALARDIEEESYVDAGSALKALRRAREMGAEAAKLARGRNRQPVKLTVVGGNPVNSEAHGSITS